MHKLVSNVDNCTPSVPFNQTTNQKHILVHFHPATLLQRESNTGDFWEVC